jgi:hypothetical protein
VLKRKAVGARETPKISSVVLTTDSSSEFIKPGDLDTVDRLRGVAEGTMDGYDRNWHWWTIFYRNVLNLICYSYLASHSSFRRLLSLTLSCGWQRREADRSPKLLPLFPLFGITL